MSLVIRDIRKSEKLSSKRKATSRQVRQGYYQERKMSRKMCWILIFRKFINRNNRVPFILTFVDKRDFTKESWSEDIYIYTESRNINRDRKFFDAILRIVAEREFSLEKPWKERGCEVFEYFRLSDTLRATAHLDRHLWTWIFPENSSLATKSGITTIRTMIPEQIIPSQPFIFALPI